MTARPACVLHCQHSLGLGHLSRSLALAGALAERFRVIVLSGGRLPPRTAIPDGVELVELAPMSLRDGELVSDDPALSAPEARRARRLAIERTIAASRPRLALVELFPFGRRKLTSELVGMIDAARAGGALVASSVRDILVGRGARQRAHDERAKLLAERHLDLVLVHSDPRLARLEDSFRPRAAIRVPVRHTGFVMAPPPRPARSGCDVLVSAGGGRVGERLLAAAIAAAPELPAERSIRVIAGPFCDDGAWARLGRAAAGKPRVELVRSLSALEPQLLAARASISQCGYNTSLELLRSRVPALVAPFSAPGEDEQSRRAELLAANGWVRRLDPQRLAPARLAAAIAALDRFEPSPLDLDLDGAERSAEILHDALEYGSVAA